jgi:hypothetical protein
LPSKTKNYAILNQLLKNLLWGRNSTIFSAPRFKGTVSRDLMRKKRPFDGFIGWIIRLRYSRIGFIFNFKAVFIFKFLNLYAQPVYLWGAHASGAGMHGQKIIYEIQ